MFALAFGLLKLFLSLLLLLHNPLNHNIPKLSHESVDGGFRTNGQGIVNFEIFVSWVFVFLFESKINETVDHLQMIVNMLEWDEGLLRFEAEEVWSADVASTSFGMSVFREENLQFRLHDLFLILYNLGLNL